MDREDVFLLIAALIANVVALVACSRHGDEVLQRRTVTVLHFERLLCDSTCEGWFPQHLRCSKASFLAIAKLLKLRGLLFANAVVKQHSYEIKIAAAPYFFASSGGYRETATAVGMSKSYVIDIVNEVARMVWMQLRRISWYPGVVGAVDGSLLQIDRPEDYEGFYCRKGYPAINIQAIVSASNKFMSVEIRPGSWSDSKCWKHSIIGRDACSFIPAGTHFIGDSGYALLPYLMVPFAEREEGEELNSQQRRYNFLHSSTRMAVECTFGLWKGRLRVLQTVMDENTLIKTMHVVMATIVLHNLMLDLNDDTQITSFVETSENEDSVPESELPVFFLHGVTGNATNGRNIQANLTAEGRVVVGLTYCENECSVQSVTAQIPMAIEQIRNIVKNDSRFNSGCHFVGRLP
ncbi:DDE superfamily endonuclease [Phytophthora infestans]|uniref:DDE superfamily endonuclease n=1 Tax=Phytophthora infestans TaxID=4787 RepID=A0A8S9UR79_PHYIN|nr:DDE superfamily endonuclease [Phytophthora infestans]KAF4141559.1 DDE superfamily endonuclease [Phytophthora infestans]